MNYFIIVDASGNIINKFQGGQSLAAPWIAVTAAQYAAAVSGSTWSGTDVVAPVAPVVTAQQLLQQQALAQLSGGVTITSTGTPALSGLYSTDAAAQQNIGATQIYIQANAKFPGSSGTMVWLDRSGTPHVFPSVAAFTAFATAVADFVADCTLVALTGTGTLPSTMATIP